MKMEGSLAITNTVLIYGDYLKACGKKWISASCWKTSGGHLWEDHSTIGETTASLADLFFFYWWSQTLISIKVKKWSRFHSLSQDYHLSHPGVHIPTGLAIQGLSEGMNASVMPFIVQSFILRQLFLWRFFRSGSREWTSAAGKGPCGKMCHEIII